MILAQVCSLFTFIVFNLQYLKELSRKMVLKAQGNLFLFISSDPFSGGE